MLMAQTMGLNTLRPAGRPVRTGWLHVLFFVSGFPALLYQIVWERSLFTIFGTNIESVTIIVTAFMLGLGIGGLAGARIAADPRRPLPLIFAALELGVGCFGLFSLRLFHAIAELPGLDFTIAEGGVAFLLLLAPTMMMGSTLPILAAYVVSLSGNVGRSVGSLYCVNTLGSAAGCFFAAAWGMGHLGLSGNVALAASLNVAVGLSVLAMWRRRAAALPAAINDVPQASAESGFRYRAAVMVTFLCGFTALGYEILWFRAYSFASAGAAPTFPSLLGCYLMGIALGSSAGRVYCKRTEGAAPGRQVWLLSVFLVLSGLCGYLVVPAASRLVTMPHGYRGSYLLITAAAFLFGAAFPLVMHVGIRAETGAGRRIGTLYAGNIAGSTLGGFIVGYVLMDHWTFRQIAVFLGLCGVGLGMAVLSGVRMTGTQRVAGLAGGALAAAMVLVSSGFAFDGMYERLLAKQSYSPSFRLRHTVETKSGVIAVTDEGVVYGGGAYDGVFNVSPVRDVNSIYRPFSLSLWHPNPRRVLMIGLSSGSWAQVVANHPQVESLTIVEINPGYLRLIPQYPEEAGVLRNPKVSVIIDDGRRWLRTNPGKRFDVMVMNTTFYWRAHASNLLSKEFLELVKSRMEPGGVAFYNTTGSANVQATGASVFPYGVMVGNCLAVSTQPLVLGWDRWKEVVRQYRIDGRPAFRLEDEEHRQRFGEWMALPEGVERLWGPLVTAEQIRAKTRNLRIVTDDNMACEWETR